MFNVCLLSFHIHFCWSFCEYLLSVLLSVYLCMCSFFKFQCPKVTQKHNPPVTVTWTDTLSSPVSFFTDSVMVAVSDTSADGIVSVTDVGVCSKMWCSSLISCWDSVDQVGVGVGTPSTSTVIWMVSPGTVLTGVGVETILAGTAKGRVFLTIYSDAFTKFTQKLKSWCKFFAPLSIFILFIFHAFLVYFYCIYETLWKNLLMGKISECLTDTLSEPDYMYTTFYLQIIQWPWKYLKAIKIYMNLMKW